MIEDFRLKVFAAAASLGSFTRAAQSLHITQPAVSQNIAELEKNLGVQLFERGRSMASLTPEGQIFQEYAAQILHAYDTVNGLFAARRIRPAGEPVKVAATEFVAVYLLPRALRRISVLGIADFRVRTCPEEAFPGQEDADVSIFTSVPPDELPESRPGLHFIPSPDFEGMVICSLLRKAVEDSIQSGIFKDCFQWI